MYNRYACRCDEFRRAEPIRLEPPALEHGCGPPPPPYTQQSKGSANSNKGKDSNGLLSLLNFNNLKILPKDMDIGDILLYAVLFLLFLERGDEECLIILLVLFFMN